MALDLTSGVLGLQSARNLYQANRKTNGALEKLSSGLRINRGADDPAGLIVSELLRAQISGYQRALRNTQESNNVMSIAEGGLSSVSSMLEKMRGLAVHALNSGVTSGVQVNADQMEMNSLLNSVNRVVNTTSYAGNQLLNGAQALTFNADDPGSILDASGTSITGVAGVASGQVDIGFAGASTPARAASATADLSGALDADGNLAAAAAMTINGSTFAIDAGTSIEGMVETINANIGGATAYVVRDQDTGEAAGIRIDSDATGSTATVSIANGGGVFAAGTAVGEDAVRGDGVQAERAYLEADFASSTLAQTQEFTVAGANGAHAFTFDAGASIREMAERINSVADSTGVNAYAIRNEGTGETAIRLVSGEYGSAASVQVQQSVGGAFAQQGTVVRDYGQDANVAINGSNVTTRGLTADFSGNVDGSVAFAAGGPEATTIAQTGYDQDTLTDAVSKQTAGIVNVTGGMRLQLGEGGGGQNGQTVSIGNYNPAQLGRVVVDGQAYSLNDLYGGGSASLANNPEVAMRVISQAIADVSAGRANIGAYQANALETNANNLMTGIENLTSTESDIRDADMAEMMSLFVASKLLQDAGLFGVQSANQSRRNVLQLLGGGN